MEPEGPLLCSQEPTTCPYPKRDASSSHLPTLFPKDPNIILSSMSRSSE